MTELADCGAVIVGSATHNNNVLPGIADVLTYMKGLRPQNRVAAAFGSYGWSGESAKIIQDWLASMNMELPADPLKILFVPKHEGLTPVRRPRQGRGAGAQGQVLRGSPLLKDGGRRAGSSWRRGVSLFMRSPD